MNTTKNESSSNAADLAKWFVVVALVAAGVFGNAYFSNESLLLRVVAVLVLAGVALAVAFQTAKGGAFWRLIKEARTEIRKVVWPTNQETTQTTLIVMAVVLVAALLLWGMDSLVGWLVSLVIG